MDEMVLDVPIHLVIKGLNLAASLLDVNKWPEDDWYALDENWDLNFFSTEDEVGRTVLVGAFYAVDEIGLTQTREWQEFFKWTLYDPDTYLEASNEPRNKDKEE